MYSGNHYLLGTWGDVGTEHSSCSRWHTLHKGNTKKNIEKENDKAGSPGKSREWENNTERQCKDFTQPPHCDTAGWTAGVRLLQHSREQSSPSPAASSTAARRACCSQLTAPSGSGASLTLRTSEQTFPAIIFFGNKLLKELTEKKCIKLLQQLKLFEPELCLQLRIL